MLLVGREGGKFADSARRCQCVCVCACPASKPALQRSACTRRISEESVVFFFITLGFAADLGSGLHRLISGLGGFIAVAGGSLETAGPLA